MLGRIHSVSLGSVAVATRPLWIVDPDNSSSDPELSARPASHCLSADHVFSTHRHPNLYTFDAQQSRSTAYVEVKIGGHPLDHRLLLEAESQRVRPHGPLKTLSRGSAVASNQSLSFEAREQPALVYSTVKIGGHALDHVPFFDRGVPSRPLWGFSVGRAVDRGAAVPRGLAHLFDCVHCRRLRQSPNVRLCCGHALCAACLASDALRHVAVGRAAAALSLLECRACDDFVAVEAVVFPPDRVLRVDLHDGAPRSLRELKETGRADAASPSLPLSWKSGGGGAVAALALVAARLLSPRARQPAALVDAPTAIATIETAAADASVASGAARWKKRVQGLRPPSKLLKYSFVRTLGVGNFAEVVLVRDRKGALCVLKESDKLPEAVNEIGLLSKIRSPHVVRIAEYFVEEIGHRHFAYIEMEFCDQGDLLQHLQRHGAMDATTFEQVFRQLCLGLAEIHARGIIHRDLKPGNVLLTSDGLAKIADFGVSTCLESNLLTHHAAGTLAFMAPEVRRYFLGEDVSYDTTADIWSLGALAVSMLSGDAEPRVATRIIEEVVEELVEKHDVGDQLAAILTRMLDADPHKRPTLPELLDAVPHMSARL